MSDGYLHIPNLKTIQRRLPTYELKLPSPVLPKSIVDSDEKPTTQYATLT